MEVLFITILMTNLVGLVIVLLTSDIHEGSEFADTNPFISVVISVRNESANIKELISCLSDLDYPKDRLEILIGDDHSDDETWKLLQKYSSKSSIKLYEASPKQQGKAAMLDKLTKEAKGDLILFTDADVRVSPQWAKSMVAGFIGGQAAAMTRISGDRYLDCFQNIDWLSHQRLIHWFTQLVKPMTIWGNNMVMSANVLKKVNYYEGIKESIVEDVAMMAKVIAVDQVSIISSSGATVTTKPCDNYKTVVGQRLRWIGGFGLIQWYVIPLAIIKYSYFPVFIALLFYSPYWLLIIPLKMTLLYQLIKPYSQRKLTFKDIVIMLCHEPYEFITYFWTFVLAIVKKKVTWKNRTYVR